MPPFGPKMTEELRKCRALANALDRAVDDLGLETNRGEGSVSSMVKLWPRLKRGPKSVSKRTIATAQQQPSTPNGSAAGRDVGERRGQVRSPAHPCLHFTHTRPPPPALGVAISALDFRALVEIPTASVSFDTPSPVHLHPYSPPYTCVPCTGRTHRYWKYNKQQKVKKDQRNLVVVAIVAVFCLLVGGFMWYKKGHDTSTLTTHQVQCVERCTSANFYCDIICEKFKDKDPR